MAEKRYIIVEPDGNEKEADDLNWAVHNAAPGSIIIDRKTGQQYTVRKDYYGNHPGRDL